MYRLLACVSVLAAPLLSVAAADDQPQTFTCASRPKGFVDLDDSSSAWPVGKVVVLEGFVGSVHQDVQSTQFQIKVRRLPPPRRLPHGRCILWSTLLQGQYQTQLRMASDVLGIAD